MITPEQLDSLRSHLQTAVEVELSTVPIYLYTYYSLNRMPENTDKLPNGDQIATFSNKAGGILMSVAVEEMLHLSLASNMLKALGGSPQIYGKSPAQFPCNLPHHKDGFLVNLSRFTNDQLSIFLDIEKPAPPTPKPEGDQWETLGQFYEYIAELIYLTEDSDYSNPNTQLADGKGYYASSNVDTIYPKDAYYLQQPENPNDPSARGATQAQYPNNDNSGNLKTITCKADALNAIATISEQGEGYPADSSHQFDDPEKNEESHWFKYNELQQDFQALNLAPGLESVIIHPFPLSPQKDFYPAEYACLIDLTNATYSYLLWMTEMSFTLQGAAQSSMFYIGMHKGMIFILDKIIGGMRYLTVTGNDGQTYALAPTFENYQFASIETAKSELVSICEQVLSNPDLKLDANILSRIKDLPDVNVVNGVVSFA